MRAAQIALLQAVPLYEEEVYVREAVGDLVPFVADALGNFISGINSSSGDPIPNGAPGNVDFGISDRMGYVVYGQSLSTGTKSQPAASLVQPYSNLTFGSGPKSAEIGNSYGGTNFPPGTSTSIPLVEDNLAMQGATNQGETICTVATSTICELALSNLGVPTADNRYFASSSGKPGVGIESLDVDSTWWFALLSQFQGQFDRAGDLTETYIGRILAFLHGEADAQDGRSFEFYLERLINGIVLPANAAMATITGQTVPLFTQLYQTPHRIRTNNGVALAQYAAALQCSIIDLVANNFPWPRDVDGLHLTNVGERLGAYYFGRAAYERIFLARKPRFLKPGSAYWENGMLTYTPDVIPVGPLVLDPTIGATAGAVGATSQNGFFIRDDSGDNALGNFAISGDGLSMTCQTDRAPVGQTFIRSCMDALAPGLNVDGGASCNLRDSTSTMFNIAGTDYPTYHICPAVNLQVVVA